VNKSALRRRWLMGTVGWTVRNEAITPRAVVRGPDRTRPGRSRE
jgi:hypothetical protein